MTQWQKVKIGDCIKRIKRPLKLLTNKEYKLVTIKLHHKGVVLRGFKKGGEIKSKMYQIREGDFLLSGIDARNGAFGIAPKELDGAIVTNDFWYFDIDKNIIDKNFFLELTTTTWFDEICRLGSDGTTQRIRLQKDKFFNQTITLPSIEEQRLFIDRFINIKNQKNNISIEITHQQTLLKKLRQTILQEAIEGKLTKDWRKENPEVEPATILAEKIKAEKARLVAEKKIQKAKPLPPIEKDEIPFEIPVSWEWCRLGEIGFCQTGTTPSTEEKDNFGNYIPFVKPGDVSTSRINYENEGLSEKGLSNGRLIPNNSIIMVCIGGSIGKSYFTDRDISCNQQINTITLYQEINTFLIQYYFQTDYFQSAIWGKASGGTTPIVNRKKWESIHLPIPPVSEQKEIVKKVDHLFAICDELEGQINDSIANADMLMQAVLKEAFEQ